jgi:hypothetical protein
MLIALCSKWRPWTWDECVTNFLRDSIDTAFGGFFELIYELIGDLIAAAVGLVIKAVGTLWVYIPTLHPSDGDTVSFMRSQVWYLVIAVATVSVIIAGMRMAWSHRGEPVRDLLKSLLTLVVVSGAGVAAVGLLTRAGDALAETFIDEAVDRSGMGFAENLVAMVATPLGAQALPIIVVFGFAAVVTSFIQIVLMIVRNAMLILLAGVLPLAAAATNTEMGQAWFRRICGWLIAFIAYKPFAALIYAAAITLAGSQGDLIKMATGLTMMMLSVITLPALLRLVSPPGGG